MNPAMAVIFSDMLETDLTGHRLIIIIIIIIIYNFYSAQILGARAQKRNKTKSLIIFKSRGHAGVIISVRVHRLFKVEKQF